MKKYIYTGEYFHQTNPEFETYDVKIGLTKDYSQREKELSNTNGPIKYEMTTVWEISIDGVDNPAVVIESICHSFFNLLRYNNNEWFSTDKVGKLLFYNSLSRGLNSLNKIPGVVIEKINNSRTLSHVDTNVEKQRGIVDRVSRNTEGDPRIIELCGKLEKEEILLERQYKGERVEVRVTSDGMYHYMGEQFNSHNKMYNNGIVFDIKGERGGSGNSSLKPYTIIETGQKISEIIILQ